MARTDDPTAEATALLQDLIRNACVNDGTPASGEEVRSSDLLTGYLEGTGLDIEHYEPQPGRRSMLAKIEGSDPTAPTLLLMGHTDVVPVNVDGWSRDPFGAELDADGMIWGRGAVDMLNLTATMAVAFRRLADTGFKPKGTLAYLAVADEEALGTWGADWLVDHELDDVKADYVVTESGGFQMPSAHGTRLPVMVEEKGTYWSKLTVHGTPGHASSPYRTDNALVTAAEVVRRIAEFKPPDHDRRHVAPVSCRDSGSPTTCSRSRASASTSSSCRSGSLASRTRARTRRSRRRSRTAARRRTSSRISWSSRWTSARFPGSRASTPTRCCSRRSVTSPTGSRSSPTTTRPRAHRSTLRCGTSLGRASAKLCEGSALVPMVMTGGTDNRFFRRAGSVGYGFGLFSQRLAFEDYATMFHGNDERVDQESLALSTQLWLALAEDLLE